MKIEPFYCSSHHPVQRGEVDVITNTFADIESRGGSDFYLPGGTDNGACKMYSRGTSQPTKNTREKLLDVRI
jgi:hypothetical protein